MYIAHLQNMLQQDSSSGEEDPVIKDVLEMLQDLIVKP